MSVAARQFASDELVKECFDLLDSNNNGSISADDAVFVVRALGFAPNSEQANAMKSKIGQSKCDYSKTKSVYKDTPSEVKTPQQLEQGMRNAFQALDSSGDGKILESEMRHILRNLGDQLAGDEVDELMLGVKSDYNGNIDYDDFIEMLVDGYPVSENAL